MKGKVRWLPVLCALLVSFAASARAAEKNGRTVLSLDQGNGEQAPPLDDAYGGPPINEDDPASSVPNIGGLNRDPIQSGYLLMELDVRAEQAEKEQDWPRAVRYYQALAKAVPDRAVAFARECRAYAAMSEKSLAIDACRKATSLPGVKLDDFVRLANLLIDRTPEGVAVPPEDVKELEDLVLHLREQKVEGPDPEVIECRLAIKMRHQDHLQACIDRLEQKLPNDPTAHAFRFSLALMREDWVAARGVIDQARQASLPAEAIGLMQLELSTREQKRFVRRASIAAAAVGVPGLVGLLLVVSRRRRRLVTGSGHRG